jgi:phospholipase/carboxylesterase
VFDAIDGISNRYSVHPRRVFLVGYCEGGTAALRIGLRHPQRFAGVVSLGGALPKSGRLLMNLKEAVEFPLLWATYRDSVQWPVEAVCRDIRLMHGAGMRVDVRQYPESGELCTKILGDVNRWLMAQVTGTPLAEVEEPVSFSQN